MGTRSVLFTPGDEEAMVRKSLESDVDVVVIDFEDAASPANKEQARETTETILLEIEDVTPQIWIRINQLETGGARDIAAIDSVETMPDEIVLPMVNSNTDVRELETTLDSHGIESGIIGILETAPGVHRVDDIVSLLRPLERFTERISRGLVQTFRFSGRLIVMVAMESSVSSSVNSLMMSIVTVRV